MRIGCDLPYENYFIDKIFTKNGTKTDALSIEGNN